MIDADDPDHVRRGATGAKLPDWPHNHPSGTDAQELNMNRPPLPPFTAETAARHGPLGREDVASLPTIGAGKIARDRASPARLFQP